MKITAIQIGIFFSRKARKNRKTFLFQIPIKTFGVFDEAEKKSPTDGFNPSIDDGIPSKDDSI